MIRPRDYARSSALLVLAAPISLVILACVIVAYAYWPLVEDWFALNCVQLNAAIASLHPAQS